MSIIRKEQLTSPLSASYALTASYAENAVFNSSSLVTTSSFNAFTASINSFTASYNTGSFTGSFIGDFIGTASYANNSLSASYALTASYALNIPTFDSGGLVTTSSFNAYTASINAFTASINIFTASYNTGSFTGSFTGSLFGTSSWAVSASQTVSASHAVSASYVTSASYAATASYVTPLQQNVIITGSIYIPDNTYGIYFSGSGEASRLIWNNEDGTLELGLKGGIVKSELGQGLVTRIVNKTVPNIDLSGSNYQVVVVAGAQGQRLAVKLAQANNDVNSAGTLGIVAENIAKNQEGFIVTVGLLKNRNTTGALQGETWSDGDVLYLSPTTAGAITNIKPQAPQHTVIVGYVEYAHAINGKIYVKIDNGYELDELHNVRITTASLSSGDLLVYSSSIWVNTKQLTGSYNLTGSLQATSFTGSLQGTSSWAQNTLTASYVNPLIQNVQITGSLFVSNSINSSFRELYDNTNNLSINWENRKLNDNTGAIVVDYSNPDIIQNYVYSSNTHTNAKLEDFSSVFNYAGVILYGVNLYVGVSLYDLVSLEGGIWVYTQHWKISATQKLGIVVVDNGNGTGDVLMEGDLTVNKSNNLIGPYVRNVTNAGLPIYIADSFIAGNGTMSETAPNNEYVRILGHLYYNNVNTDTRSYIMRFNPSNDYYRLI